MTSWIRRRKGAGVAGEIRNLFVQKTEGVRLQGVKDKIHDPLEGMPVVGIVVIDEHRLAARHNAGKQSVDDGLLVVVGRFVKQEIAGRRVIGFADGRRGVGETRTFACAMPASLRRQRSTWTGVTSITSSLPH